MYCLWSKRDLRNVLLSTLIALGVAASASRSEAAPPIVASGDIEAPFPDGFLFGTAIAGFQVDMGCPTLAADRCDDRFSDWYQFVTDPYFFKNPLLFLSRDSLRGGPGFWETYRDDLRRAHDELGTNAMRISIEWSRIFPSATFGVKGYTHLRSLAAPDALAYYHELFAAMRALHITPIVTLNHYTLPLWMHDAKSTRADLTRSPAKGWLDSRIVTEIAKYAGFVAHEFRDEVKIWATLNEPFASVVIPGFVVPSPLRSAPPGLFLRLGAAREAAVHMIEAHAAMYDAIHREDSPAGDAKFQVGLVNVYFAVEPAGNSPEDRKAADDFRYFMNDMFTRPLLTGELDRSWDGKLTKRPSLKGKLDFIGLNYYSRFRVKNGWIPGIKAVSPYLHFDLLRSKADNDYPAGIYQAIAGLKGTGLPIMVTETGIDAARDASLTAKWLVRTLAYTRQAIADGHDVRGYFFWTLMDNYEWNHGFDQRFGLYAVDPKDPAKKRTPRSAVPLYSDIIRARAVPHGLVAPIFGRLGEPLCPEMTKRSLWNP